jgi:membrane-associated protease RseP (regulator of RpoE activity)
MPERFRQTAKGGQGLTFDRADRTREGSRQTSIAMHKQIDWRTKASMMVAAVLTVTMGAMAELKQEENVILLPPFEVRESGFTNFGISILTNKAVATGGKVEWMIVSAVAPGSAASLAGLSPGDRIYSIDGASVLKFSKAQMLGTFFHKTIGAELRLEVADPRTQARRIVTLTCNEISLRSAQPPPPKAKPPPPPHPAKP